LQLKQDEPLSAAWDPSSIIPGEEPKIPAWAVSTQERIPGKHELNDVSL
jgi:hypothetical protein